MTGQEMHKPTSTSPRCLVRWMRNAATGGSVGKALPENYGICPQRSTLDVTITQSAHPRSPVWRKEG
jgi:hypothetical protein